MENIDEIMGMLDWNHSAEIQQEGIRIAKQIDDISVFLQPTGAPYDKNVWDNCAVILSSKKDYQLEPYMRELLEWTQDLNWPGAPEILKRLKRFSGNVFLAAVEESVKTAYAEQEYEWLGYLSELLENEYLRLNLSPETLSILREFQEYGWDEE